MRKKTKTSMQDIAEAVGVSKNSVSLALSGKPGVSEALRQRILQVARALNYSRISEVEDENANKNIIVLTAEYVTSDRSFYPQFISDIGKEARLQGCNAILTAISPEMQSRLELPNLLNEVEYEGIVVVGELDTSYVAMLANSSKPVVLVDSYYYQCVCHAVVTENFQGAYTAVLHLLRHGHRDIGFIGPIHASSSFYERWIGFHRALSENELSPNLSYCLTTSENLSYSNSELDDFIGGLRTFPTAWFCANDRMAVALLQVLHERQIQVPRDVSIIGFDDVALAEFVHPKLTTIRVKRDVISREAVRLLLFLASEPGPSPYRKVSVYGELIERGSVRTI